MKSLSSTEAYSQQEGKDLVVESIRELEEMHEKGEIETSAYFIKKRALIRLL